MGYPQDFLNGYALCRHEYARLPLSERMVTDFGYFLRMRYVEYLQKGCITKKKKMRNGKKEEK